MSSHGSLQWVVWNHTHSYSKGGSSLSGRNRPGGAQCLPMAWLQEDKKSWVEVSSGILCIVNIVTLRQICVTTSFSKHAPLAVWSSGGKDCHSPVMSCCVSCHCRRVSSPTPRFLCSSLERPPVLFSCPRTTLCPGSENRRQSRADKLSSSIVRTQCCCLSKTH